LFVPPPRIWLVLAFLGVSSTGTTPEAACYGAGPTHHARAGVPFCSHGQKEIESPMVPHVVPRRWREHGRHTRGQHRTTTPAFVSTGQTGPLTVAFPPPTRSPMENPTPSSATCLSDRRAVHVHRRRAACRRACRRSSVAQHAGSRRRLPEGRRRQPASRRAARRGAAPAGRLAPCRAPGPVQCRVWRGPRAFRSRGRAAA